MGNVSGQGSCTESGCDAPPMVKGMCRRHYAADYRARRHGPTLCRGCGSPIPLGTPGTKRRSYCDGCPTAGQRRTPPRSDDQDSSRRLTCQHCGDKLAGKQRLWCSGCVAPIEHAPKACVLCAEQFTPKQHNQRFCCKSHRQSYENAKHRGTLDKLLAEPRLVGAEFDCAWCEKHCVPGENVAPHATKFCGYDCKAEWHHVNVAGYLSRTEREQRKEAERFDKWTRKLFAEPTQMQTVAHRRMLRADPCSYCNGEAEALDHIEPKHGKGVDDWTNRTASCRRCNSLKGTKSLLEALLWIPPARQYHDLRRLLHAA